MKEFADRIKFTLAVVFVLILGASSAMRLMKIQVVQDEEIVQTPVSYSDDNTFSYTKTSKATRGCISDYFNQPLIQNKTIYNIIMEKAFFPEDNQEGNRILLELYNLLNEKSYKVELSLPISETMPYVFTGTDEEALELKKYINLNVYATAENCIDKMISDYEISDEYTDAEKRVIVGFRYELMISDFAVNNDFILAENISEDIILEIKANSIKLKGINITESSEREILVGNVLPHELGTVGPIYAEEYEELSEKGYAMNDIVGKSGIEYAMEDVLRGQNGEEKITVNNEFILNSETISSIENGKNIKLTVDSRYQQKLQGILQNFLTNFSSLGEPEFSPKCGAIVVLDAKTGAVRGMATAPTYDLNEYISDYDKVLNAENRPLVNRATDGIYRPGSTFKTITATAGLNEGAVNPESTFYCGMTMEFLDTKFNCTGHHNDISISRAVTVSCNIYFYELARKLTIDGIVKYENLYGLGQSTGLETGDSAGYIASPESYDELGLPWYAGDVLQSAIGQGEMGVTPLQLACVANTIANEGIRYQPFLVEGIYDPVTNKCIEKTQPTINQIIDLNYSYVYEYIEEGMIGASLNMPSTYSLANLGFDVAIKTGTPQTADLKSQNSLFIGYAPADNPVLAFAGIIEDGEYSKYMIRDIILAYDECYGIFQEKTYNPTVTSTTAVTVTDANGSVITNTETTTTVATTTVAESVA